MHAKIERTYYPLLLSKIFIVSEIFICAAAVSRFDKPELNLAALMGLILPMGFFYESPTYDLLSASTALSKNKQNFKVLLRYFIYQSLIHTTIGVLVFVSPLKFLILQNFFKASKEVIDLALPALPLILLWPWFVGYRRILQGLFLRHGYSALVGLFSFLRVASMFVFILLFLKLSDFSGVFAATLSLTLSIFFEPIMVYLMYLYLSKNFKLESNESDIIDIRYVFKFYIPLLLSAFVQYSTLSLASFAMFRLQNSILSLSVWAGVSGILMIMTTFGYAFVDLAVLFSDTKQKEIEVFRNKVIIFTIVVMLLVAYAPFLSDLVLVTLLKLSPEKILIARNSILFSIFIPVFRVLTSILQGLLISKNKTKIITEGIVINTFSLIFFIFLAVSFKLQILGIYFYLLSVSVSMLLQYCWLSKRYRP